MKITDLMEAPPGGWLNTKAALGKADDLVRNNRLGKGLGNLNTAVSKKYGGAHGNKAPIDPAGGIDDKETDDWIAGKDTKDTKDPKPKAPAPKGAKTLDKQPTKDPKSIDDLKPGSAYNDGTATWTWTGTDWSDGAVKLDPATGFKQFKKAKNKFVKEAPGAGIVKKVAGKVADKAVDFAANATGASRDDIKRAGAEQGGIIGKVTGLAKGDDNKQTQQVAQKATALKGVVGGKASGSQVAKGLDKVAAGETLPPNIIKAIAPYATAIQTMMSNPQLFGKFKALMKQAEAGQNQQ
jgi:hypothetical protein